MVEVAGVAPMAIGVRGAARYRARSTPLQQPPAVALWWKWRESNPRLKSRIVHDLRVQSIL